MPNGGEMPCCGVCQYASKIADSSGIVCSKHDIRVTRDGNMFCADLSHPRYPGLAHFIATSGVQKEIMYMWAGVYSGKELPLGLKKNEASIFVLNGKSGKMNIALNMAMIGFKSRFSILGEVIRFSIIYTDFQNMYSPISGCNG